MGSIDSHSASSGGTLSSEATPGLSAMTSVGDLHPSVVRTYRELVTNGPRDVTTIDPQIARGLTACGLAQTSKGIISAKAPRGALGSLAQSLQARADRTRQVAEELGHLWHDHHGSAAGMEVVTGPEVPVSVQGLFDGAEGFINALCMGPPPREEIGLVGASKRALGRGTPLRVIYDRKVLSDPDALGSITECINLGEEARVLPSLPTNLVVTERGASMSFPDDGINPLNVALIHSRGAVETLNEIFETFWDLAVPLMGHEKAPEVQGSALPEGSRELLTQLALGSTEAAIARELGISERTVGRRVTRLQQILGATSRFQLGVQAARAGLIG